MSRRVKRWLRRRYFTSGVTKTHIIHGRLFFYTWEGTRHWHVMVYVFGRYQPLWR